MKVDAKTLGEFNTERVFKSAEEKVKAFDCIIDKHGASFIEDALLASSWQRGVPAPKRIDETIRVANMARYEMIVAISTQRLN